MDFFIYKIYDEDKYYCHVDKSSDTTKVFQQQKKQIKHENVFGKNGSSIVLVRQIWEKSLQGARNFLKIFAITNNYMVKVAHKDYCVNSEFKKIIVSTFGWCKSTFG